MPVLVHRLATAVPSQRYTQERALELMQAHVEGRPATRRILRSLYRNSGIEARHSVVADFGAGVEDPLFFRTDGGGASGDEGEAEGLRGTGERLPTPGTGRRNQVYEREARALFVEVGRRLLEDSGFEPHEVTHVVTVSCTGFYAPGPDYDLVRALGLPATTRRSHLGFMGCYAALPALALARDTCLAHPEAVVLVVAVELCTLHLQFTDDPDDLVAGAIFADGGAGALVSARHPASPTPHLVLEMGDFHGDLVPEGEADMAWTLGDQGFRMRLSSYVPELLGAHLSPVVEALLRRSGLTRDQVGWWAVHPGGRAIVDRIQEVLALPDRSLVPSRQVLRTHGNMSSATLLFVLHALLSGGEARPGEPVLAMAFGPGLTVETGVFHLRAVEP
jgi:predicted naringenin-chalcone synthase